MKEVMTEQNRSLVMRNKDEVEMEQILIDVMQSLKLEGYGFKLAKSQMRAFQQILQNDLPLKLFLFILDE